MKIILQVKSRNLLRSQTTRIFNNNKYTLESFEGISLASRERPNEEIDRDRENRDREREKGDGVFPALRRGHEAFNHESHIGSVNGLDFSPFARNLFLSCGSDGTIHLKHLLELCLRNLDHKKHLHLPSNLARLSSKAPYKTTP